MPDTPEIDTCAPRVPSRNSKFTYTGWPSRPNPTGTLATAHLVEVQRGLPLRPDGPADRGAGQRRHIQLGLDPGHGHLGDLAHLGRERAAVDQEHIRGEPGALVHCLDVRHHPGDPYRRPAGQRPLGDHHVVELCVLAGSEPDGELQRGRGNRADHQAQSIAAGSGRRAHRSPNPHETLDAIN